MGSKQNNERLNLQSLKSFMMVTSFCTTRGFLLVINNTAIQVKKGFHRKLI